MFSVQRIRYLRNMSGNTVKAPTKGVEVSLLVRVHLSEVSVCSLGMFLFKISVQRVLVPEDAVQFVVLSTLIWSKHNTVWCAIMKLLL